MKAREFLLQIRRTPGMYAANKEAFCAMIVTALQMDDIEFMIPGHGSNTGNFYAKHIGRKGSAIVGCNDSFDDVWAHAVVDDALSLLDAPPPEKIEISKEDAKYCWANIGSTKFLVFKGSIKVKDNRYDGSNVVVSCTSAASRDAAMRLLNL